QFARIHRSAIVRLERIASLAARRNGDCDVILTDGSKVLLSRTYRDSLRARLGLSEI
ncbi:MAG: LytTR family transcriptional regulator, partial [Alphaproteobacteria bacterium]|nr:LytTR family transcriptional regulator [Alphaproteobacteria bacterium]